jgi:hypothetical protein
MDVSEVTQILSQIDQGDPNAAEQLLPLVYDELRKLTAAKLAQERPGQTLQATALVHEAYIRLVDVDRANLWNSRGHFFAAAAEAIRRILIDRARRKRRLKHGGDRSRVDLKPSNVLVTLYGSRAVPKVIDFGVAKAIHQRLTERALYTRYAQMIGTPIYMSPEQAALSGLDVDTRSDLYSLGVLLYELLTGATPLDRGQLREASYDEIRRAIREEEPPTPSQRLETTKVETLRKIAERRRTEPGRIAELLRGDLDWIAMKAIEKAIELSSGGSSLDSLYLAMAHWQEKNEKEAREAYDQALRWMRENEPGNEELRRLRAEAQELLR